ncbi:ABC transporter permease [Marinobacter xiaoshiensis]|uniref:Transport permease protein n=1 Tax=Marinobacter xiaoshiensis TaxID=3073652 RepID=A0ABU2HEJ0_9GAMM|nr:ABC transporter permease [Marinobacter sp. F60267]MDS1309447.1 ABC transporter permease [Marinobacter sp. F60267]
MQTANRTPWQITIGVWQALFLREAVARISADRVAWLWLLAEPIAHVLLLVWVRTLIGRVRLVPGAEYIPWLVVGITTFIMFRNQMNRGMEAISANRGLFAYRQVQPVDTVIARCGLEGILSTLVFSLIILLFSLAGYHLLPQHPLQVLHAWLAVWVFGAGVAMIFSVIVTSLPEAGKFIRMVMFPLYFLSGVMIPVQYFPHELQQYLIYNPMLHAIELLRTGIFEAYRPVSGISFLYLHYWVWGSLFLGLLLQLRFRQRLLAQ